jgi:hypothetical protein
MRGKGKQDELQVNEPTVDTDTDRYPTVKAAFSAILNDLEDPERKVDRVEATCLANGDVTYRSWSPRSDDAEGSFIPHVG